MAIVTSATFAGLDINRVRIDSTIRASDALAIARMQSHVWQRITATTGGGTLVAPPHIHDGSNGAIIPIPLSCNNIEAEISRAAQGGDRTIYMYAPISYQPYYAAPGVNRIRVIGLVRREAEVRGWRVRIFSHDADGYPTLYAQDDDPKTLSGLRFDEEDEDPDAVAWHVDIDTPRATGAGATPWFSVEIAAWDGYEWPGEPFLIGPPSIRRLRDVFVLPVTTPSVNRQSAIAFSQSGTHTAGVHLGVEETLLSTDRSLSSFVVDRMSRNDISIPNALLTHTHGNNSDRLGTVFEQHLFSHGLGTMRSLTLEDFSDPVKDAQIKSDDALSTDWTGRISAPCLIPTAETDDQLVSVNRFQMPPGENDDLGLLGADSRMQCAALVNYVTNATVSAQIFSASSGLGPLLSSSILSSSGTGRRLVVLDGIKAHSSASGAGQDQNIAIFLKRDGALVDGASIGLYGYALAVTE